MRFVLGWQASKAELIVTISATTHLDIFLNQQEIQIWCEQETKCSDILTYCFERKRNQAKIELKQLRKTATTLWTSDF